MEEMYKFIKEHLSLWVNEQDRELSDGSHYRKMTVKLVLKHPTTGEDEVISEEVFSIDS